MYQPRPLTDPVGPTALFLAQRAKGGRLTVFAGAGVSMSEPTHLPSGADLARKVYRTLTGLLEIPTCDESDLMSVADAVEGLGANAIKALQETASRAADFCGARSNFSHESLAVLTLEGAITLLVTNWDTCVERAAPPEAINAVLSTPDLQQIQGPVVLKVHGCASRPSSMLVTTSQLSAPPIWAGDETAHRLSNSTLVFIGVGDVAPYVRVRITEAAAAVPNATDIFIVSLNVWSSWNGSAWELVTPKTPDENKIEAAADEFLDELTRAYVGLAFTEIQSLSADLEAAGATPVDFPAFRTSLLAAFPSAAVLIRWIRHAAFRWESRTSVLHSGPAKEAILALAKLALGTTFGAPNPDGPCVVGDDYIELIVCDNVAASQVAEEAYTRLEMLRTGNRKPPAAVLCAGHIGRLPRGGLLASNVVANPEPTDVIDGPAAGDVKFLDAADILKGD